ncbi:hypothetical protein CBE90_04705 [Pasteurella multocida]|uniref:type IV secretion system protein n=1 Tax=Pasteurella multocida TaxID=747 RepID=UPI000CE870D8|nr:type IV secretion system protein [Pasteurella multocida]PPE94939.1 hypothetical protein CBE90_04705 [Pasteurella multocida]PPE95032.1 hypothetical protein CBE91_10230 [Pasteurella multocida]HDR1236516.1 type IV secretion system protein [Pasteurella multocida]HDR1501421.1 type IV secretion system protein [Pasteurella multocida]
MSKLLKITTLSILLSSSLSVQAGGIPVIDGAQIGNQISTWAIEAQRWTKQLNQYKQDFENQKNQLLQQSGILQGMTGVRDMAGFMNEVKSTLKDIKDLDKWLGNTESILKHGKEILSANLKKAFDEYGATNLCKNSSLVLQKKCEGEIIVEVLKREKIEKNAEKLNKRISTIENIAKKMRNAKDMKEAQDLSNAMQTQMALLQTDKIAMDLALSTEEYNRVQAEKQKQDEIKRINANFKYVIK